MKGDVAENVKKQAQLMEVIGQTQAAYKQAFGYNEWRAACEVGKAPQSGQSLSLQLTDSCMRFSTF